jgi:hypothetical protein
MNELQPDVDRPEMVDKPPLLGSWRRLYALEIGVLVALILVFWLVTEHYA